MIRFLFVFLFSLNAFAATTTKAMGFWPNGEVPYVIESNVPRAVRQTVERAINRINSLHIVKFSSTWKTEPDSLAVFTYNKGSCQSTYGHEESSTLIKISEACSYGTLLHEMLHALGFVHEQANPTRPFDLKLERLIGSLQDQYVYDQPIALTPHDPDSIMHYGSFIGSVCSNPSPVDTYHPDRSCVRPDWFKTKACWSQCAVFLDPVKGPIGGQRIDLSALDIKGLRKLYAK